MCRQCDEPTSSIRLGSNGHEDQAPSQSIRAYAAAVAVLLAKEFELQSEGGRVSESGC